MKIFKLILALIAVGGPEDDACSTDGEKRAVVDDTPLLGREFHIIDESTCITVVVLEGVAQPTVLVS